MANIRVDLTYPIVDGSEVALSPPVTVHLLLG